MTISTDNRSIQELAREALQVQDACNLSGIVLAWGRAICRLRQLIPGGTDDINQHHINVLWADKVNDLTRARYGDKFSQAYEWATNLTHEEK